MDPDTEPEPELLRDQAIADAVDRWTLALVDHLGWADELDLAGWGDLDDGPPLPRTARAARAFAAWLHDDRTVALVAAYPDDLLLAVTVTEATATLGAAVARVRGAIDRILAEAEAAPLPIGSRELERPARLARQIGAWLGDGPDAEARAARAGALHDAWRAHLEALDDDARAVAHELARHAAITWAAIVARAPARHARDLAGARPRVGELLRLEGVRNRAGRDFDGSRDVAIQLGELVLAGDHDPAVARALADVARRIRRPIAQDEPWDLLVLTLGTGRLSRRIERSSVVASTGALVSRIGWEPIRCVSIRVVGLHAGPVAVAAEEALRAR